jgi:predicted secreted protein
MYHTDGLPFFFIVLTVILFLCLGTAILVIVDHKAQIPGEFPNDPFSISGMRRDHPVIAFLTTTILFAIIASLLFEIAVTLGEPFFRKDEGPQILAKLKAERVSEKLRHFHNEPVKDVVNLGEKSVCFHCHGDYPHSKEPMVRTLLNMHTQFAGCMTCHNDPDKIDESTLQFSWLNFSGIDVTGPPFGTDINPESGDLIETDDYYSKIVATGDVNGISKLLEVPESDDDAREFIAIRDTLTDLDREALKKSFHKLVSPKGRFCSRCHTEESDSYLPFRELGFSDQRVTDVTNLNIIGITQKYKKFYMPNLFDSEMPLPDSEKLLGPDIDQNVSDEDDPNAWWQSQFDQPPPENKKL